MTQQGTLDRDKLAKVLALLSSDHDGEALAAARRAMALARKAGLSWQDILQPPAADPITLQVALHQAYGHGFTDGHRAGVAHGRAEAKSTTDTLADGEAWALLADIRHSQGLNMPAGIPDPKKTPWTARQRAYVSVLLQAQAEREAAAGFPPEAPRSRSESPPGSQRTRSHAAR